ncbi:MAG: hypothetical protein R3A10_00145 [Caldilineaceae bacterium]
MGVPLRRERGATRARLAKGGPLAPKTGSPEPAGWPSTKALPVDLHFSSHRGEG